jgi:hypothetical protein
MRGPAFQRTGMCSARARSRGRQHGDSSVIPTISIVPKIEDACFIRSIAAETRSLGRIMSTAHVRVPLEKRCENADWHEPQGRYRRAKLFVASRQTHVAFPAAV